MPYDYAQTPFIAKHLMKALIIIMEFKYVYFLMMLCVSQVIKALSCFLGGELF